MRINGRLHLPALFRSLPRPSSPPGAKASPMRPYSLPSRAVSLCRPRLALCTTYSRPPNRHQSTPLSSPFYFYFSPSLVNELFESQYPVSSITQANEFMQYSQWVSMLILWTRTTFRSLSKPLPASKICNLKNVLSNILKSGE